MERYLSRYNNQKSITVFISKAQKIQPEKALLNKGMTISMYKIHVSLKTYRENFCIVLPVTIFSALFLFLQSPLFQRVRVSSSNLWEIAWQYLRWRRWRNWECTTQWLSRRRSWSPLLMAKSPCMSVVSLHTTSVILAMPALLSPLTSSTGLFCSSTIEVVWFHFILACKDWFFFSPAIDPFRFGMELGKEIYLYVYIYIYFIFMLISCVGLV